MRTTKSHLRYFDFLGNVLDAWGKTGGQHVAQQGDPLEMIIFCLSVHHIWGRTLAKHHQDACAVAYADDGYIKAKLSVALEVLSDLKHVLKEDSGLSLNFDSTQKSKTKFLVKGISAADAHAAALLMITANPSLDHLRPLLSPACFVVDGYIGLGVPIGTDAFTITRYAASYTTNARFVAFLGTFARPAQQVWLPGNDIQDRTTWDAPPFCTLKRLHRDLLQQYDCTKQATPQPPPSSAGGGAAANAGAHPQPPAGSQDNSNGKLLLPQLDRLHLAFKRRQVSPSASSSSQDQQAQQPPKSVIPTQKRVTEQLTKHWAPFKVLRHRYACTRLEEQRQLHLPQKYKATVPDSTLRVEMNNLEEQADNAKARELYAPSGPPQPTMPSTPRSGRRLSPRR